MEGAKAIIIPFVSNRLLNKLKGMAIKLWQHSLEVDDRASSQLNIKCPTVKRSLVSFFMRKAIGTIH